jgi:hypothetical protein
MGNKAIYRQFWSCAVTWIVVSSICATLIGCNMDSSNHALSSHTAIASTQVNSDASNTLSASRVDFHKDERLAAAKSKLKKEYPDNCTLQTSLYKLSVESMDELESLVNGLSESDWKALKGSYDRLAEEYYDAPNLTLALFKREVESYRGLK